MLKNTKITTENINIIVSQLQSKQMNLLSKQYFVSPLPEKWG